MAEIPIFGTMVNKTADGKAALTSQLWDEKQNKFQSEINDISKGNILNINEIAPLSNGYYTLDLAITAIKQSLRKTGACITYQVSERQWETKQYIGDDIDDENWHKSSNWVDFNKSSQTTVFNPTVENPISGYYSLIDSSDETLSAAHVALNTNKATLGLLITFQESKSNWKTYQYVGSNTSKQYFTDRAYWKEFNSAGTSSENYIVIDNLCGSLGDGNYYTLYSAIRSLIAYQNKANTNYIKTGLIISYISGDKTMETKQFQGTSAMEATQLNLWKDLSSQSGSGDTSQAPYTYSADNLADVISLTSEGELKQSLVSTSSDGYKSWLLQSSIQVRKGQQILIEAKNGEPTTGTYSLTAVCDGCTAHFERSTLLIDTIDYQNRKSASVEVTINCEGRSALTFVFTVKIVQDAVCKSWPETVSISGRVSIAQWEEKTSQTSSLPAYSDGQTAIVHSGTYILYTGEDTAILAATPNPGDRFTFMAASKTGHITINGNGHQLFCLDENISNSATDKVTLPEKSVAIVTYLNSQWIVKVLN